MAELQGTFGETVGMEPVVPTRRHYDDLVECSDGNKIAHGEVCYDCDDGAHSNDSDRHEAEVRIVTDILEKEDEWVVDYCTENEDYAGGYDCLVDEDRSDHPDKVEDWLRDKWGDYYGHTPFDDIMEDVVEAVVEEIDGSFHCNELEYCSNEYAGYSGPHCCLASFDIGEYENQIDFDRHVQLQRLHDLGRLDDVLDDVNCDVYPCRDRRREKNEKTGYYEYVGRETYNPYGRDCTNILASHSPGGQWYWLVHADVMDDIVAEVLCRLHGIEE